MHEEYWNGYVALGIVVGISLALNIVGFLSVGYELVGLEKARTDTNTYAEQQCTRQQAERAASNLPVLNGDEAPSPDPETHESREGEREERDWCDLAAQQSMADSTVGMEQAAWVALALTTVGIVLVWRTLYYTRETLKEAREGTNAAVAAAEHGRMGAEAAYKANHITAENAFVDRRPWLHVEVDWIAEPVISTKDLEEDAAIVDFEAIVYLTFKNTGRTPALCVHVCVEACDDAAASSLVGLAYGPLPPEGFSVIGVVPPNAEITQDYPVMCRLIASPKDGGDFVFQASLVCILRYASKVEGPEDPAHRTIQTFNFEDQDGPLRSIFLSVDDIQMGDARLSVRLGSGHMA